MVRHALVLVALTGATLLAQSPSPPAFEVASVKPNVGSDLSIPFGPVPPDGITMINRPLESIIRAAYDVQSFRMTGLPRWANEERFDISARASRPITEAERKLMMRALLVDRFRLKARMEPREQTVYVMTRVRPDGPLGPGLRPRPDCVQAGPPCVSGGSAFPAGGRATIRGLTLATLASGIMSSLVAGVVVNETKTDGFYDLELTWRPDVAVAAADANDARPAFFTAVQEQLGLKLEAGRRPVDVLVIESLERPTPD
jgi:uncharacterized protein (TIGR03435 family)